VASNLVFGARLTFLLGRRVVSSQISRASTEVPVSKKRCGDTGYAFVLEILEAVSAEEFHIICNFTVDWYWDEVDLTEEQIESTSSLQQLCRQEP